MKVSQLVGERFKERPAGCVIDSHALMLRGGYMKQVAGGIYSQLPPLRRVCRNIEQIIRQEMDAIGGQEVLMPVVLPGALWEQSGRYASVGSELLRLRDRNGAPLVLGMTHEEAAVHLAMDYGNSYSKYPFMIYQIQTKFRDEGRPRAGLIRVREFTMKDAYSFHTSQEDLERYYQQCHRAYERIFARVGLPEVVSVAADSGMMGGSVSHEFMLLTPAGEDSVAVCPSCGYRANVESAPCATQPLETGESQPLTAVYTPNIHTIEDICAFLGMPKAQSCKAVVYQRDTDGGYVALFLRGDLEVNEAKLTAHLGCGVRPADITPDCGLHAGYIGPVGLPAQVTALFDRSLEGARNLSCGANQEGYHYTGLDVSRDCGQPRFADMAKLPEGGQCPRCGKPGITVQRGIEVGNIFQLGDKYTRAMGMQYLDQDGALRYPVMGCYGIGVGRLAASVCEARHDEHGPIWPVSISPWSVQLCSLRAGQGDTRALADGLYRQLLDMGLSVLYDDRAVSAGVMFSDADLLGAPVRVIVSPRNIKEGVCELITRDKAVERKIPLEEAACQVRDLVSHLQGQLEPLG